jgi:multidrug efflux pump subunit AcrA (membrane-fusion protein)
LRNISLLPGGLAVAAVCLLIGSACTRPQAAQAPKESGPIQVAVVNVETRDVQRVVESVGTMFPYDESVISAEIDGRVDGIKVDLGDQVTEGQELVHISDEEYRYMVAQQEAQFRQALERLGLKNENDKIVDVRQAPGPRQGASRSVRRRAALQTHQESGGPGHHGASRYRPGLSRASRPCKRRTTLPSTSRGI